MNAGPTPDPLAALKERVRWMWSQGDYTRVAVQLQPEAEALVDRCRLSPGTTVLDVAAGNGNFAIAAAIRGAVVTASDVTPRMVELGRGRSQVEAPSVNWLEADAEALPFPDTTFDVVASTFGAMFAPRPELVASEMFRVARPGGLVAMANYGSEGFLGRLAQLMAGFSPHPATDLPSPFLWGDAGEVRRRLGTLAAALELESRTLAFTVDSFEGWRELWEDTNPTLMTLKKILPTSDYGRLMAEAKILVSESSRGRQGPLVLESSYLSVLARRRSVPTD